MNRLLPVLILLGVLVLLVLASQAIYTVPETEQVVITQFGELMGDPVTSAGLHVKTPFVQTVNRMEKRVMEWESSDEIPTADKLFIKVDTYARWRISDAKAFYQKLHDERTAQTRLDDILDGETRSTVAKHPLIELVRNDKNRQPKTDPTMSTATIVLQVNWIPVQYGRDAISHEIGQAAKAKLKGFGIDLIDIRFKRINYNEDVQEKIFNRMISERQQIAEKFRSEGAGEAARIAGEKQRELNRIESEAYRKTEEIRGKADADAIDIYAKAYNQSPEAVEFYQFQKTMETYAKTLDKSTELILSTQGDFFKFLKDANAGMNSQAQTTGTLKQ